MTWWEIYDRARIESGQIVPQAKLTPALGLTWASEAQSILQSQTNAVKCHEHITVNGAESYPLRCEVKVVDAISFTPANSSDKRTIRTVTPEEFTYISQNSGSDITIPTAPLYITIERATLRVFPNSTVPGLAAISGTLDVRYKPYLSVYSPSNTDSWRKFGDEPDDQMQNSGPEREMTNAIPGIVAYTKAMLIMQSPRAMEEYKPIISYLLAQFEASAKLIQKDNVQYSERTVPRPYLNGTF